MSGQTKRKAVDFLLHVELGGLTGVVAPLIGKQPPDYHIWILPGTSPAFIREQGPLYDGGPIWQIEQISPAFRARSLRLLNAGNTSTLQAHAVMRQSRTGWTYIRNSRAP